MSDRFVSDFIYDIKGPSVDIYFTGRPVLIVSKRGRFFSIFGVLFNIIECISELGCRTERKRVNGKTLSPEKLAFMECCDFAIIIWN